MISPRMYVRVGTFTYAVTCVVRWKWWFRQLMCLFCLKFKLNTGSVEDCDWLDQVGCNGDISETVCFRWILCCSCVRANDQVFFSLLKSTLSGMAMWIWWCNHRIYNSPVHALFPRAVVQVLRNWFQYQSFGRWFVYHSTHASRSRLL